MKQLNSLNTLFGIAITLFSIGLISGCDTVTEGIIVPVVGPTPSPTPADLCSSFSGYASATACSAATFNAYCNPQTVTYADATTGTCYFPVQGWQVCQFTHPQWLLSQNFSEVQQVDVNGNTTCQISPSVLGCSSNICQCTGSVLSQTETISGTSITCGPQSPCSCTLELNTGGNPLLSPYCSGNTMSFAVDTVSTDNIAVSPAPSVANCGYGSQANSALFSPYTLPPHTAPHLVSDCLAAGGTVTNINPIYGAGGIDGYSGTEPIPVCTFTAATYRLSSEPATTAQEFAADMAFASGVCTALGWNAVVDATNGNPFVTLSSTTFILHSNGACTPTTFPASYTFTGLSGVFATYTSGQLPSVSNAFQCSGGFWTQVTAATVFANPSAVACY